MKIGIISDTHIFAIDDEAEVLLKFLNKHFADCDLLLHAGDIVSVDFIEELSKIAPVEAVSGNMDLEKTKSKFPPKKIIEVENKIIGLIHGSGPPQGIHQRICVGFTIKPDIIVYGHTHEPFQGYENGVFYINPGSPNDTRFAFVNSVAILELNKRKIDTQIVKFDWSEIFKKYSKG
ncbi:MAG: metallophosphatase family protein [Actinobacteria bacterium]|nr:metallophosphatase family protein [Actinomycetota bacterium]